MKNKFKNVTDEELEKELEKRKASALEKRFEEERLKEAERKKKFQEIDEKLEAASILVSEVQDLLQGIEPIFKLTDTEIIERLGLELPNQDQGWNSSGCSY